MADFDIRSRDRHCTVTGKELGAGQVVYSALVQRDEQIVRLDFCEEAWTEPPEGNIGWWKAFIPEKKSDRVYWAPNSVVLSYFHELRDQHEQAEVTYLLTLLMVRRRILRMEDFEDVSTTVSTEGDDEQNTGANDASGSEQVMIVTDPTDDTEYRIPVVEVAVDQIDRIQDQLCELLFSDEPPTVEDEEEDE